MKQALAFALTYSSVVRNLIKMKITEQMTESFPILTLLVYNWYQSGYPTVISCRQPTISELL